MKKLTLAEFHDLAKSQNVERDDIAFICPMCDTIQSPRMLIQEGVGACYETVRTIIGFRCVGRFTGKGSPSVEKGKNHGCNWSLGGLLHMHRLEVSTPGGEIIPCFELASPEQAQELRRTLCTGEHHE